MKKLFIILQLIAGLFGILAFAIGSVLFIFTKHWQKGIGWMIWGISTVWLIDKNIEGF